MRTSVLLMIVVAAVIAAYAMHRAHSREPSLTTLWQQAVVPGALSSGHADLGNECDMCHSPLLGVSRDKCVMCHANETELLTRQPTSFHADIDTCSGCHMEHRGRTAAITDMDHEFLSRHGLTILKRDTQSDHREIAQLLNMVNTNGPSRPLNANVLPEEAVLNCVSCHLNDDRHWGLFGDDCVNCHEVKTWSLATFRHPSARSQDCAQCHQAPPSHYMMHFKMISAKVAGKPHAPVADCFQCHQTTSWNDIKRVGIYKHH